MLLDYFGVVQHDLLMHGEIVGYVAFYSSRVLHCRSKFEGECDSQSECLRRKYRIMVHPSITNVTFHDFVVALTEMPTAKMDAHFKPITMLCELNRIKYDFVGTLGSTEDADYISKRIGYPVSFSDTSELHGYERLIFKRTIFKIRHLISD